MDNTSPDPATPLTLSDVIRDKDGRTRNGPTTVTDDHDNRGVVALVVEQK